MISYETWVEQKYEFEVDDTYKGALNVLDWAYRIYKENIIYACSFGIEGIVLIDLISRVKSDAKILFLDTEVHFQETYETIQRVREKYPDLNIVIKKPILSLERQSIEHGDELWKSNPNLCCQIRKLEPLKEELEGVTAWISGLRHEQSESRKHVQFINKDDRFQSIKICPLIHWTWKDVWRYVTKLGLPYNPLHDSGYPSIGCTHCTSPAFDVNDLRSGRWKGHGKTECGLHG